VHNFYTGYLQIGWIQLGLTLGSTVLTVLTLGLFGFVATIVIPGVAVWGLVEGILFLTQRTGHAPPGADPEALVLFLTQRTGHYAVDATGRPLRD